VLYYYKGLSIFMCLFEIVSPLLFIVEPNQERSTLNLWEQHRTLLGREENKVEKKGRKEERVYGQGKTHQCQIQSKLMFEFEHELILGSFCCT